MIKEAIEKLMQAENLTYDQVKESVDEIMTGQASPALIASSALRLERMPLSDRTFCIRICSTLSSNFYVFHCLFAK